jgi:hypothetical protein
MSMQAASLEVLEKANVPAPQARAIVQAIEMKLEALRDELRAELHANAKRILRHLYAMLLGQSAVLLGIAYFFVTHLQH